MISTNLLFENATLPAQYRKNIHIGDKVAIVLKKDQRSGILTIGIVEKLLTSKQRHTRGIKVRLRSKQVGRVQKLLKK